MHRFALKLVVFIAVADLCAGLADDTPLILTPLIHGGRSKAARTLSQVVVNNTAMGHSGYFTVEAQDSSYLNNLFFWYQPCKDGCNASEAPLLLWLQGGPGGPGTFGATSEIGNWWTDEQGNAHDRCFSWCRTNNCLFLDQPVWTGFSFQTDRQGRPLTEVDDMLFTNSSAAAAQQVYKLLLQFYQVFPELQGAPMYITGESYGGIYVPNVGIVLAENEAEAKEAGINFTGIAIGDPVINWKYQVPTYASTLYGMGVIMLDERAELESLFGQALKYWETPSVVGNCRKGFTHWNSFWNDDGSLPEFLYDTMTGSPNTANVLMGGNPMEWAGIGAFFSQQGVHRAFHFAGAPQPSNMTAAGLKLYDTFVDSGDFCTPTSALYARLFLDEEIDLMIYSSTADPLLGPPTTEAGVQAVLDDGAAQQPHTGVQLRSAFNTAKKAVWRVDTAHDRQVAGYAKCVSVPLARRAARLCYTVVRNAGHESPAYQPRANYDMLNRFLQGRAWDKSGDAPVPDCDQCGGVGPFAGPSLPECQSNN